MNCVETFGKTKEEAIEKAALELNVAAENLSIEILEEGTKGFLGFLGSKDFKIRASVKESLAEDFSPRDILMDINPKDEIKKQVKMAEEVREVSVPKKTEEQIQKESAVNLSQKELEDTVYEFLEKIFEALGIYADIDIAQEGEFVKVRITGPNAGILIGRRGESLDALQLLLGLALNKKAEGYVKLHLDIENYREKREESLIRYAHKMARMASKQRRNIRLEPMNPNERRIIHSALQSDSYVSTYSEGEEPYRKVVIAVRGRQQH